MHDAGWFLRRHIPQSHNRIIHHRQFHIITAHQERQSDYQDAVDLAEIDHDVAVPADVILTLVFSISWISKHMSAKFFAINATIRCFYIRAKFSNDFRHRLSVCRQQAMYRCISIVNGDARFHESSQPLLIYPRRRCLSDQQ